MSLRGINILLLIVLPLLLTGCMNMAMSGASAVYNQHNIRKKFKDNYTTFQAYRRFNDNPKTFKDANISVTTYNRQVLLTGQAPKIWQRTRAEEIIRQLPDVQRVYNFVAVASPSSTLTRISDAWLTSKVKAKIIASDQLDATQIKVVSENGTVYLMGVLQPQDADEVVRLASETEGVESVVKIFTYVQLISHQRYQTLHNTHYD